MPSPENQPLLSRASALFHTGRLAEAVTAYETLLAREPALPDSWFNLAMARRGVRDFAGALDAYARALAEEASGPEEIHVARAAILSDDLADPDAARAELDRALAIAPDHRAALLNLGNLREDLGDRDGARDAYERVLARDAGDLLALSRVVTVGGATEARLAQLRAAADDPRRAALDRADAGFALAGELDRRGEYGPAFAAARSANAASAELARAARARFDPGLLTRFVDESIATFTAPEPDGGDAAAPVFICGMFRSGSTLVERILAAHPQVVAGGEIAALPALAASLHPYPSAAATTSAETIAGLRARYAAETAGRRRGGALLTDKRPDNIFHLGLAKRLFPRAKIVWTTRDVRDTALSAFFLHTGPELAYTTELAHIAHVAREQARLMAHWRALYPKDIHEVRYERLIETPEEEIARLLSHLGLDADPTLHERFFVGGAVRTASHWQVRRPLYASSVGRWRNYPEVAELTGG